MCDQPAGGDLLHSTGGSAWTLCDNLQRGGQEREMGERLRSEGRHAHAFMVTADS